MNRRRNLIATLIVTLLVCGVLLSAMVGNTRTSANAQERARTILLDSAKEQVATMATAIEGQFRLLETAATSFGDYGFEEASLIERLDAITAKSGFSAICFTRPDGMMLLRDEEIDIADRAYFRSAMGGRRGLEAIERKGTREPAIAFAVPYYADGRLAGALCGLFNAADLSDVLTSQAYGGEGYSMIVDVSGDVIINNSEHESGEGSLSSFRTGGVFDQQSDYASFIAAMVRKESGTISYRFEGRSRIAAFVPFTGMGIPENDWYVLSAVSTAAFKGEERTERSNSIIQTSIVLAFCLLAVLLVLQLIQERNTELAHEAEELRLRDECFRVAATQSGRNVFTYDIAKRYIDVETADFTRLPLDKHMENAVEDILRRGAIADAYEEDFRAFFRRIDEGEPILSMDVPVMECDGRSCWYRFNATTLFSAKGEPRAAVVSCFDCTQQRERELAYAKWQLELASMPKEKTALFEWNLTKDLSDGEEGELISMFKNLPLTSFDARTATYASTMVYEEDRPAYEAMLKRERLIGAYYNNITHDGMDFREIKPDGGYRWMHLSIQLIPYPDSDDIKAYISIRDIDQSKREELSTLAQAESDPFTGALRQEIFSARAAALLRTHAEQVHALMVMELKGLQTINSVFGYDFGNEVLRDFAKSINLTLRTADLFGRIGNDRFALLTPNIPFEAAIAERAAAFCSSFDRNIEGFVSVSLNIGVAVYTRDGASVEELEENAGYALGFLAPESAARYIFYSADMRKSQSAPSPQPKLEKLFVACSATPENLSMIRALRTDYQVLHAHDLREAETLQARYGGEITAELLDIDDAFGEKLLHIYLSRNVQWHRSLIALTSQNRQGFPDVEENGAVSILSKPVEPARLRMLIRMRTAMAKSIDAYIQKGYGQLQSVQEQRNREILNATGTVVFLYDPQTHAYTTDALAAKYLAGSFDGRPLDVILRQDCGVSDAALKTASAFLNAIAAGEKQKAEMTAQCKTPAGDTHWFNVHFIRLDNEDARSSKVLITLNDEDESIKAQRQLQLTTDQLRSTTEHLQTVMSNVSCGISAAVLEENGDFHYLFVNDQYYTMFGYTKAQFEAEIHNPIELILPEDRAQLMQSATGALQGRGDLSCEYRSRKRDGSVIWVSCAASTARFPEVDAPVQLAVLTDITSERNLRQIKIENMELSNAVEKAQIASRTKGDFLANVSHDIRTPMNAILGFSQPELVENATEAQKTEYLQKINATGHYLLSLINDVLDISKIESGKFVLQERPEDGRALLSGIENVIRPLATQKGVQFHIVEENVTVTRAKSDRMRMQQVFINLLNNAIKFTPPGGSVTLTVKELKVENGRVYNRFTVQDTGIGMKPAFLARMYDPFEQETDDKQGTGLGLTIVKNIVEKAGGTIQVESVPMKGTTFTVFLSFALCDGQSDAPQIKGREEVDVRGLRMLLCEDHPMNVEIARRLLEKAGVSVESAENGQIGVEKFRASAPGYYDAILMDVRMPVLNGLEATRQIRALPREDGANIPIIAMTANAFDDDAQACLAAGMNAHLSKPIVPAKLFATIAAYCRGG
ncbi:MAG: response regulator [Clostridia bacterium]|nr:response regulator [Clostridia bacterium]